MEKKSISRIDIEIGARLKAIRMKNHLSQEKMAAILGIESRTFYPNVEKGKNRLTLEHCLIVCEKFDVSVEYLLTGKVSNTMEFEVFFDSLSPKHKIREFMAILSKLCGDEEELDTLIELAGKLKGK